MTMGAAAGTDRRGAAAGRGSSRTAPSRCSGLAPGEYILQAGPCSARTAIFEDMLPASMRARGHRIRRRQRRRRSPACGSSWSDPIRIPVNAIYEDASAQKPDARLRLGPVAEPDGRRHRRRFATTAARLEVVPGTYSLSASASTPWYMKRIVVPRPRGRGRGRGRADGGAGRAHRRRSSRRERDGDGGVTDGAGKAVMDYTVVISPRTWSWRGAAISADADRPARPAGPLSAPSTFHRASTWPRRSSISKPRMCSTPSSSRACAATPSRSASREGESRDTVPDASAASLTASGSRRRPRRVDEQRFGGVGRLVFVDLDRADAARVEVGASEDDHDQAQRQPLRYLEGDEVHLVQVLDHQLDADPRDDDEGAVDERRVALDERQQLADQHPHRDDAEEAAGDDHPQLVRHRDRDQDRVDGEDDVGELHLHDGGPERRQAEPRPGRLEGPLLPCVRLAR